MLENIKARIAERLYHSELFADLRCEDQDESYRAGIRVGKKTERKAILADLEAKSLEDFKDKKLALGYQHAVEVVKGTVQ